MKVMLRVQKGSKGSCTHLSGFFRVMLHVFPGVVQMIFKVIQEDLHSARLLLLPVSTEVLIHATMPCR